VRRIGFAGVVASLAAGLFTLLAQETPSASPESVPTVVRSQADCTGFVANPDVPHNLFVVGGADDDFRSVTRQFVEGESIRISPRKGSELAVNEEYSVVRSADELFLTSHYEGQRSDIARSGRPYEDVAKIKLTHVDREGAMARITFSCQPVMRGDIVVPLQARAIPEYVPSQSVDRFTTASKEKYLGRIIGTPKNAGFLGKEAIIYLNVGEREGALPGQRFRIFRVEGPSSSGSMSSQKTPPETVGEAVVLSVQARSCVAIVISSIREISAGDYVENEGPGVGRQSRRE